MDEGSRGVQRRGREEDAERPTPDHDAPDRVDIDTRRDLIVERVVTRLQGTPPAGLRGGPCRCARRHDLARPPGRRPLGPAHDARVTISQAWACLPVRMLAVTRRRRGRSRRPGISRRALGGVRRQLKRRPLSIDVVRRDHGRPHGRGHRDHTKRGRGFPLSHPGAITARRTASSGLDLQLVEPATLSMIGSDRSRGRRSS